MSNFTKRVASYRKNIRSLGGNFLATKANCLPHGITVGNLIILSGRFYQGFIVPEEDCIALYRTEPFGEWYIYHNNELSEMDYNRILKALERIREKEEALKESQKNADDIDD